jgi:hypothetical protein
MVQALLLQLLKLIEPVPIKDGSSQFELNAV